MLIYKKISKKIPDLKLKLIKAGINQTPEEYVQKTAMISIYLSLAVVFIGFMFLKKWQVIFALPILIFFIYSYFIHYADYKAKKISSEIEKEIVFAGRFLIIELNSGVPLFKTFENLSRNYDYVGKYFENIVEKINLGTTMEDALNETIEIVPSDNLKRLLWQIINSIKTGADIEKALDSSIDQIVREQKIEVKEYAKKLNPLAMFYMMMAIIVPSLGITMLIVLATFIGMTLSLTILMIIAGLLTFMQFMFLAIIRNSRPNVEL
jgi:flagellar protein FlaJ